MGVRAAHQLTPEDETPIAPNESRGVQRLDDHSGRNGDDDGHKIKMKMLDSNGRHRTLPKARNELRLGTANPTWARECRFAIRFAAKDV